MLSVLDFVSDTNTIKSLVRLFVESIPLVTDRCYLLQHWLGVVNPTLIEAKTLEMSDDRCRRQLMRPYAPTWRQGTGEGESEGAGN